MGLLGVAQGVAAGQEFGGVAVFGGDRFVFGEVGVGAVDGGVAVD